MDLIKSDLKQLGIDQPFKNKKFFIGYGGPVESGRGFILHSDDLIRKETLTIDKGVALTNTAEFFDELAKDSGPRFSILALGYTGWGPGQLEYEIKQNSWMNMPIESSFLFDENVRTKWDDAYKLMGVNSSNVSIFSGNA